MFETTSQIEVSCKLSLKAIQWLDDKWRHVGIIVTCIHVFSINHSVPIGSMYAIYGDIYRETTMSRLSHA